MSVLVFKPVKYIALSFAGAVNLFLHSSRDGKDGLFIVLSGEVILVGVASTTEAESHKRKEKRRAKRCLSPKDWIIVIEDGRYQSQGKLSRQIKKAYASGTTAISQKLDDMNSKLQKGN